MVDMNTAYTALAVGEKIHRLTAASKDTHCKWLWRCECGSEKIIRAYPHDVRVGKVKSCGCLAMENRTKHGKSRTKAYAVWSDIISRCNNPKSQRYANYGGRGIQVKFSSFEEFYAEVGDPPKGMSIDRIDNNGHYEAGNLRWATPFEQQNNTRRNKYLTYGGRTQSITMWAKDLGINRETIYSRVRFGFPVEQCLSRDIRISRLPIGA